MPSGGEAVLPIIYRGWAEVGFFAHAVDFGQQKALLRVLPGNRPATGDRYACIVPLLNYGHLDLRKATALRHPHYTEILEPAVLDDLRAGRAVLVFDLSNEGPAYHPPLFDPLYDWIAAQGLDGRVVWLAQNRVMQARAMAASGGRAGLLRFEHYDYFLKWMARDFSPMAPAPVLGRDPEAAGAELFDPARKDRLLLCLNATPRLQRVLTVAALLQASLLAESLVSFPGMTYVKEGASAEAVRRFIAANPPLAYLRQAVEQLMAMSDLRVDDFAEQGNALANRIDPVPYQRSFFSLVTESDLSNGNIDRITEKTAKAFCMGHPTIVVGNPNSVIFMTDLGFSDWSGLIDRGHERIADPITRFQAVMDETRSQVGLIRENPGRWLGAAREVGLANLRHAVGGGFLTAFERQQERPLIERLHAMVQPA